MPRTLPPKAVGDIAEMIFHLGASTHGLFCSHPFGGSRPYDAIVDNGHTLWRIQVKSSCKKGRNGLYQIHSGRALPGRKSYSRFAIDFFAFYIVRENAWYIVPVAEVRGRLAVTLYSPARRHCGLYAQYYEAWHLLHQPRPCSCTLTLEACADPTLELAPPQRRNLPGPRLRLPRPTRPR